MEKADVQSIDGKRNADMIRAVDEELLPGAGRVGPVVGKALLGQ